MLIFIKVAHKVRELIHHISHIAARISMVTLFLMMILISADVFGRYCLNRPITGSGDIIQQSMVIVVFFALAFTTFDKGHVTVGLFTSRLSNLPRAVLNCATSFVSLIIISLITWRLFARGWTLLTQDSIAIERTQTISLPITPFIIVAAIGLLLSCFELAIDFITYLAQALKMKFKK